MRHSLKRKIAMSYTGIKLRLIDLTEIKLRAWVFDLPYHKRMAVLKNFKALLRDTFEHTAQDELEDKIENLRNISRGPFEMAYDGARILLAHHLQRHNLPVEDITTEKLNNLIDCWILTLDTSLNITLEDKSA
jgi:hypothetical protein